MNVTQWEQHDVQRLWVTVNGYRLPSSKLRVGVDNEVSILTEISPGDVVIMTNMIPNATPDEEIYLNAVNTTGEQSIYRANVQASFPLYYMLKKFYIFLMKPNNYHFILPGSPTCFLKFCDRDTYL